MPVANDLFLFGGFRLDRRNGGLFRKDAAGGSVAVAVGSRALDVLTVLVGHPGELVSKDAIMNAVWPDVVIEEKNLTVQISALRRVLDDGRKDGSCIQTEAGRGYRFVAAVARPDEDGGTIVPPEWSYAMRPANVRRRRPRRRLHGRHCPFGSCWPSPPPGLAAFWLAPPGRHGG